LREFYPAKAVNAVVLGAASLLGICALTYAHYTQIIDSELQRTTAERRSRLRSTSFHELPRALISAIEAVENQHAVPRLSTQVLRRLSVTQQRSWNGKIREAIATACLERRMDQKSLVEYYSNQVYLGRHGTRSITGFAEASHVFFGKDLSRLTVADAATLVGLVGRPGYWDPFLYPDRTRERRNWVLSLMRHNGSLSATQYAQAAAAPLAFSSAYDVEDGSYFLDLANQEIHQRLGDRAGSAERISTTLDPDLQRMAELAVANGMRRVDGMLRRSARETNSAIHPLPEVALVALEPHSGEVRALVGGRSYARSRFNHATARRQPGSAFEPFVYAVAMNTAIRGEQKIFTPISRISDEPTAFWLGDAAFAPSSRRGVFEGMVTLRQAFQHSLTVPSVKIAEEVGYGRVANLASRAGLKHIQPTPAAALGAYEVTPLELAAAYTIFANGGEYVRPVLARAAHSPEGVLLYQHRISPRRVLDRRVAYLLVNMMESSGAHPAAAASKGGVSHDVWFAGFTSRLLCLVWIGFDDGRDLSIEVARSARPIWADFMRQARNIDRYRDAGPFETPPGVVRAGICPESGLLAAADCPKTVPEVFIDGTQPVIHCSHARPNVLASGYADRSETTADEPEGPTYTTLPDNAVSAVLARSR